MKIAAILSLSLLLAACSKKSSPGNPVGSSSSDTTISFSGQIQPIFTKNCALSGCHAGAHPVHNQNLSAGQAYSNIVNVPSAEKPGYDRVKPFSPDSSYLYLKITGSPLITGVQMPYLRPALPQSDISAIKQWIEQGALNN